jgi:hypothetical protein
MAAEAHNKVQRQMMQQHEYLNEVRATFFGDNNHNITASGQL